MENKRRAAFKQAFLIVILMALIGLVANKVNPRGARFSFHRPVDVADADSFFVQPSSNNARTVGGVAKAPEAIHTISTAQLVRLLQKGQAVLVDARLEVEFQTGHIPTAISLPFEMFLERREIVTQLPKDKWLVCYCDGPPCDKSQLLAQELKDAGFNYVAVYDEGLDVWRRSQGIEQGEGVGHE